MNNNIFDYKDKIKKEKEIEGYSNKNQRNSDNSSKKNKA